MDESLKSISNRDKIAVVVVGYNRLLSIKRLLESLERAEYPIDDVPLVISIDCSGDNDLYNYVRGYIWPFGKKYVIIHENRLGLRQHIFSCGDLTQYFKGIILLEDDIYVSSYYYRFALDASNYYDLDPDVSCIALYAKILNETVSILFTPRKESYDVYATQVVITWGQCWTQRMWREFRTWLNNNENFDFTKIDIPDNVKKYTKAWSKYFYAFLVDNNKFVISPYDSLTTNFSDAGVHNLRNSAIAQVPMVNSYRDYSFAPAKELVQYDSYMNPIGLGKYLGVKDKDICIDLCGNHKDLTRKYLLSVDLMPYKCIRKFALALRPIEENVINNVQGDGIYLYDVSKRITGYSRVEHYPIRFLLYQFGFYSSRLLFKYCKFRFVNKTKNAIRRVVNIWHR